ncbi:target of Nesh-SH3 isoform X5 [Trichomycterus rosablanca]|uniref:target of Nesh-SH3 isoform X5 n=1 Tax=Trichomycterus rosablanca TaxID=2290929 RepID=UPI002F34F040
MTAFLLLVILSEVLLPNLTCASRVRRQNTKVRISSAGDTIMLKFLQSDQDTKLEGYIVGYGSNMFSKQFIQLPENGEPYETVIDAEPKYLIAVQPIIEDEVKKECAEQDILNKPLHLVIGSVTPTSVLLSWGTILRPPYTDANLVDCSDDSQYTVRYKEKESSDNWSYQTCPTTDTVIEKLNLDTTYEFGVRAETDTISGTWSPPVTHNTDIIKPVSPVIQTSSPEPTTEEPHPTEAYVQPLQILQNVTSSRMTPTSRHTTSFPTPKTTLGSFNSSYSVVYQSAPTITQSSSPLQDTQPPTSPVSLKSDRNQDQINSTSPAVHPSVTTVKQRQDNTLSSMVSPSASTVKQRRGNSSLPLVPLLVAGAIQSPHGEKHKGIAQPKPVNEPLGSLELQGNPLVPFKKKLNQVEKEKEVKTGDLPDLKQLDQLPLLKPQATPVAEKSVQSTAAPTPTLFTSDGSRFDWVGNSSGFSSVPVSDVDAMGKKRFVAPHVIYKTDKPPDEPCSVTQSLSYFPEEEGVAINVTGPPKTPPTNLTVVTVEGCPSFIILDWEKTDNETTEYDVTSSIKSPNGDEVSVVTTNQTHTAVENLKPESSYEFTVIPKNELGSGPPSEPVSFNTESADPRVSEIPTGKNAIWSSFPFKADSYSECTGNMYVKRTWYRKFVGIQLCNSLRYKIYLSDSLKGKFYNIGDVAGNGEDHCQFVDSYLDGRTGGPPAANRLPLRKGFFRSIRQEPVRFGKIGGNSHINYVAWYECGVPIPGSW